eukprot:8595718-Alexandrium_andersonii.AAC.1
MPTWPSLGTTGRSSWPVPPRPGLQSAASSFPAPAARRGGHLAPASGPGSIGLPCRLSQVKPTTLRLLGIPTCQTTPVSRSSLQ